MLEAPSEHPRKHQDGQKSSLISSVSQRIRSLGTRFNSTNTLLQKSHRDAILRTAINFELVSCLGLFFSFADIKYYNTHSRPCITRVGCRPESMLVSFSTSQDMI